MTVIGIRGNSPQLRNNLTRDLIGYLTSKNKTVAVFAYNGTDCDIDIPGKDSYRHRTAGAREVLAVSKLRWALVHESTSGTIKNRDRLLDKLRTNDIILAPNFPDKTDILISLDTTDKCVKIYKDTECLNVFNLDSTVQMADFILSSI